jgi:hypothetical protein
MLLALFRPSDGQQKRSVLQSLRVAGSSARRNANATSSTILQESITQYSGIAVALNARGQAGCKRFVKLVYWFKFGKRSDRLGCKTSVRLTVTVAVAGDSSKTSPEIVASAYHLAEPSGCENYGQHFRAQSIFAFARAIGATQEAHFHFLLPPFAASQNP